MLRVRIFFSLIVIALIALGVSLPFLIKETIAFTIPQLNKTITIEPTDQATFKEEAATQITELSTRAQILGDNTEKVLSTAIQADTSSDSSMTDRAIEYGKYLYCKQVVADYDNTINK